MLNNLTNFFNLIRSKRIKTQLEPSDLIAVGTKQSPALGNYKPTVIKFSDLQAQLGGLQTVSVDGVTITGDGTPGDPLVAVTGGSSYKVYTALLTQTGTDAPVATVLENSLGGTPVWYRNDVGSYIIELIGAFTTNQTIILPPFNSSATGGVLGTNIEVFGCGLDSGEDSLYLTTGLQNVSTGAITASDNVLYASPGQFIEIRVYN
jgi:hypothetical protein